MALVRTAMLLAAMTALFGLAGFALGGEAGMLIALVIAAGMNLYAFWGSHEAVLRTHNARFVTKAAAPEFVSDIEEMARRAGMPVPKAYIIDEDQPNAFATGRNPDNAAVAATTGLLRTLSREEVAGVMAHELAHIKNRDTLIMTVAATLAGAITMLANFAFLFRGNRDNGMGFLAVIATLILAPLAAGLVQMAISRTREYEADKVGAEICGQPLWLASALAKISGLAQRIDMNSAERNPGTAHMFIVNPLHAHAHDKLFSTHPATGNRIRELQKLSEEMGHQPRHASAAVRPSSIPATRGPAEPRGPWR